VLLGIRGVALTEVHRACRALSRQAGPSHQERKLTKPQPVGHPPLGSVIVEFARALHFFGFARKIRINNHFINHQDKVNRICVGSAHKILYPRAGDLDCDPAQWYDRLCTVAYWRKR